MNAESTPAPKAKEMDLLPRSSEKHVRRVEGDSPSDADNHGEELAAVDGSESSPNADPDSRVFEPEVRHGGCYQTAGQ